MKNRDHKENHNLLILGVCAVLIATITSAASLYLYHKSGDIYLDCSLPGADCPSAHADISGAMSEEAFTFKDSGKLSQDTLKQYLEELEKTTKGIDHTGNPYESDSLSDQSLGI
jgi:hypothetical protein